MFKRRRLRLGMVGGGPGALIGPVHRMAARLDDQFELVAGCFSSDPVLSKSFAAELGIATARAYGTFVEMADYERAHFGGIDAVSIVTPNNTHFSISRVFLQAGIHVLCDKPMTTSVAQAEELVTLVEQSGLVFVLTHNYCSNPMIREARSLVEGGALGKLRMVQIEYPQEWLSRPVEKSGLRQALWRTDPGLSGPGGAVADVGTHAINLACFVTGLGLREVAAHVDRFVEGRRLDDNIHVLLRFEDEVSGMLWASQVAPGSINGIKLRVFGNRASLTWSQAKANQLRLARLGEAPSTILAGQGSSAASARLSRVPYGCPEGFLEGFANLYTDAAELIWAKLEGRMPDPGAALLPTVWAGLHGMQFIEAALESGKRNSAWVRLDSTETTGVY